MSEANTASVHGVPGERARATGVVRALWPLLSAIFLFGLFVGVALPTVSQKIAGAGLLAVAVFLAWAARDGLREIDSFFKGARGEEKVALLLAALPSEYHVFHDVPCGRLNGIDHVVAGPSGLFVIETKCWSGAVSLCQGVIRVSGSLPSRQPVEQARAEAHALAAFLADRMESVPDCVPIVCFASNTLDGTGVGADSCKVCNASDLLPRILSHAGHLTPVDVERIVKVMEQMVS